MAGVTFFDSSAPDLYTPGDLKLALVAAAALSGALTLTLVLRPPIRRLIASDYPDILIGLGRTAILIALAGVRMILQFTLRHRWTILAILLDLAILIVVLVNVRFVIFLRSMRVYYVDESGFLMHTMPADVSRYEAFIDVFVTLVIAHRLFRIGAPRLHGAPQ